MEEQPNLNYLKEISGGDLAFEEKLISVVKKELPPEIEEYLQNMSQCRWKEAAENVHKLKHKISILGLEKGYQTAIDFEMELLDGNTGIQQQFDRILRDMMAFVSKL